MKTKRLGNSNLLVSVVGFGTWALSGDFTWGPQDETSAREALRTAVDLGINFFDTAEIYGNGRSEDILGRMLHDVRDKIIIATKARSDHLSPELLRTACEGSLRRLRTDRIDLYQLHWPRRDGPISETIETLEQLRSEGKILYYGLSNFGPQDMREFLAAGGKPVSNQVAYSLLFRAIEYEIMPVCKENNLGVIPYSPLMEGLLTGKFETPGSVPPQRARTRHFASTRPHTRHGETGAEEETFAAISKIKSVAARLNLPMSRLALAWLISNGQVATVIAGARNVHQLIENAGAASVILDEDTMRELTCITEPLKDKLGANADMWESKSRLR